MKTIEQLAREAGFEERQHDYFLAHKGDLQCFHALAIAEEHKRLLEVDISEFDHPDLVGGWKWQAVELERIKEWIAAAVLRERERIADELEHGFVDDEGHHIQYAAAIRGQR